MQGKSATTGGTPSGVGPGLSSCEALAYSATASTHRSLLPFRFHFWYHDSQGREIKHLSGVNFVLARAGKFHAYGPKGDESVRQQNPPSGKRGINRRRTKGCLKA